MTENDIRKLNRSQLVEIIYELKLAEQKLKEENESIKQELNKEIEYLRAELSEQRMNINKAGSIAEATIGLSNVFEDAQKTADKYLKEVFTMRQSAQQKCDDLIAQTQKEADEMIANAKVEIDHLWEEFEKDVNAVLQSQAVLEKFLKDLRYPHETKRKTNSRVSNT